MTKITGFSKKITKHNKMLPEKTITGLNKALHRKIQKKITEFTINITEYIAISTHNGFESPISKENYQCYFNAFEYNKKHKI